eukprot:scaffold3474_cov246-Pinguiococcus_pyrenoidosus.AAC.17
MKSQNCVYRPGLWPPETHKNKDKQKKTKKHPKKERKATGCGLSGKHDRVSAVVDRRGDVGCLGAGGRGVVDHGLEHLRRDDDGLPDLAAGTDDALLDHWHFPRLHLDAKVSTSHHDTVAVVEDLLQVVDSLGAQHRRGEASPLDLSHSAARTCGFSIFAKIFTLFPVMPRSSAMSAAFCTKLRATWAAKRVDDFGVRHADARLVAEPLHVEIEAEALSVPQHHGAISLELPHPLFGSLESQQDFLASQLPLSSRLAAQAFRVETWGHLQVREDGDGVVVLLLDGADQVHESLLLGGLAVAEIQAKHVHSGAEKRLDNLSGRGRRAEGSHLLGPLRPAAILALQHLHVLHLLGSRERLQAVKTLRSARFSPAKACE